MTVALALGYMCVGERVRVSERVRDIECGGIECVCVWVRECVRVYVCVI